MTTTRVPTGINLIFRVISRMMVALIVSLPIIGLGVALIIFSQTDGSVPIWTGFAALIAGLMLLVLGFYMTAVGAFPKPTLGEGEEVQIERHPTMKPAYARIMVALPLFFISAVLFVATDFAYIFPFITFSLINEYLPVIGKAYLKSFKRSWSRSFKMYSSHSKTTAMAWTFKF